MSSNRDEHRGRKTAVAPRTFENGAGKFVMPVDGEAGGTWIALRNDGVAMVLLNGAFEDHIRNPSYRHSRGRIIPGIMESYCPNDVFEFFLLENIEPFTLVIRTSELTEWRWDGHSLHRQNLNAFEPHCWSSVTLYNEPQQTIRRQWFMDALHSGLIIDAESLLRWQSTGGYGPKETNIMLDRADGIGTVSTTIISVSENGGRLLYGDYLSGLGKQVLLQTNDESLPV